MHIMQGVTGMRIQHKKIITLLIMATMTFLSMDAVFAQEADNNDFFGPQSSSTTDSSTPAADQNAPAGSAAGSNAANFSGGFQQDVVTTLNVPTSSRQAGQQLGQAFAGIFLGGGPFVGGGPTGGPPTVVLNL